MANLPISGIPMFIRLRIFALLAVLPPTYVNPNLRLSHLPLTPTYATPQTTSHPTHRYTPACVSSRRRYMPPASHPNMFPGLPEHTVYPQSYD